MGQGILLSEGTAVDFMIHGVFSYELFGQTVWITTSHVCILIVMLIIMAFCLLANRAIKHATEVPGAFQNVVEIIVEMLDGMIGGVMGKYAVNFRNYIGT
ncbi:MAG: F0F1 ATP synthase subunit A, partial [Eubacterium sp.]|nr:F0F1 ATP synthase subunit A [Eubacterium sp.]